MRRIGIVVLAALAGAAALPAQESPAPDSSAAQPAKAVYTPPTHAEKFQTYLHHTFGVDSFLEAAARAGIDQAVDRPSAWQQGAAGYFERFGSAMGVHIVRGAATYGFGELLGEDLRYVHCEGHCGAGEKFKFALQNTFTARRGSDGHTVFSGARLLGPVAGGLVSATWRPNGLERRDVLREIGMTYGLGLVRNFAKELVRH